MQTSRYIPWMRRALQVATAARHHTADTPPVGAVLYGPDGAEIAAACHDRSTTSDPTALAELTVIRQAGTTLGSWRLAGCTLVTTLEPGVTACGAITLARIPRLVLGSWDADHGAVCSQWDLLRDRRLNHTVEVFPEVLKNECDAHHHSGRVFPI